MIEADCQVLPPEFRLILAASQWPLSVENLNQVRTLSAAVNWERCLELIFSNRVAPQLRRALDTAGTRVPPAIEAALRSNVASKTRLVMGHISELLRLTRGFEAGGVSHFVFKGVPLSILAYGAPILREAGDIDILISPSAVIDADRVLANLGYRRIYPESPISPRRLSFLVNTAKSLDYAHDGTGQMVDVHWRFFRDRFFAPPDKIVGATGQQVMIGEQPVQTLQTGDLLLYLCLNGWTSCWDQVRWLADVGALLNQQNAQSLTVLAERAAALGILPAWEAMLLLLQRFSLWSGACAPGVEEQPAVNRFLRVYNLCLRDHLDGWKQPRARHRLARALLLRTSLRSRLELLRVDLFHADETDFIQLPDSLLALDFLLHPAYWLMRKAGIYHVRQRVPRRPF